MTPYGVDYLFIIFYIHYQIDEIIGIRGEYFVQKENLDLIRVQPQTVKYAFIWWAENLTETARKGVCGLRFLVGYLWAATWVGCSCTMGLISNRPKGAGACA